ncbi:MAG: DUF3892 domain-containing protein [Syntrophomonas sp.]
MEQFRIVAVRKDSKGNLTNFKLNNGQELNYSQATQMAQDGKIEHVDVVNRHHGKLFLRSERDGNEANNLDNLPTF